MNYKQSSNSMNEAIKSNIRSRDSTRKHPGGDKYYVKVKDQNGQEYEIRYFF
jgi:hypothetical protein